MTSLVKGKIFTYQWFVDNKEKEITSIRIYGLDENNLNICLRIDDFTPYAYIELPDSINWDASKAQLLGNKIDEMMGEKRPLKKVLMHKKKLYGAHIDENNNRTLFPYLFCSFSNTSDLKALGYKLNKSIHVVGCGAIKMKMHESDASPILQLTCCRNISTAGWSNFRGKLIDDENEKLTLCDFEYKVKWKHLSPFESYIPPKPKIMGFDIEVNSHNPQKFPDAKEPGDKVFQISCVLARDGDHPDEYNPYLLTLGNPDPKITGEEVTIITYKTESALLEGFATLIKKEAPNVIMGYNILGFDIPYLIDRAKLNMCISEFDRQGFHKHNHAVEKTIKWSSQAFKNQAFSYIIEVGFQYCTLYSVTSHY